MNRRNLLFYSFFFASLAALPSCASVAFACPDIDELVDINCDRKIVVVCFGDSITAGVGDTARPRLGYPGRLQVALPNVEIYNYGRPGEKTSDGEVRAPAKFSLHPDADYVLVLEGVNDYWQEDRSSSRTRSNLLSIVSSAEDRGAITLLAKLTSIRRDYQISWVKSVNSAISPYTSIDYYSLGTGIISSDKVHPHGAGYAQMASLAEQILRLTSEEERPSDRDNDGIYDFAEPWFLGNPDNADTDGDGILDGAEVFTYGSSPAALDTDSDGHTDPEEISIGADPTSPKPSPPTVGTVEALPEV